MNKKLLVLTINHNIFLTEGERHQIAYNTGSMISVTGTSTPVWCLGDIKNFKDGLKTDEPAQEIFCRYVIDNMKGDALIEMMKNGYNIHLYAVKMRNKLKNVSRGGSEGLSFSHATKCNIDGTEYRCLHFINIHDMSVLLDTLSY